MMDAKDFPHTWRWTCGQIKAAERDPKTPQHIRDELHRMLQAVQAHMDSERDEQQRMLQAAQAEIDNAPGMLLWRAHEDELESMFKRAPGLADADVPLDEFVDALRAHRSYGSSKAAAARRGPRASRYAAQHGNWLHAAQQACTALAGTKAARQRAAKAAILKLAPNVSRRTLAAFVCVRWGEIEGRRAMADRRNLSI